MLKEIFKKKLREMDSDVGCHDENENSEEMTVHMSFFHDYFSIKKKSILWMDKESGNNLRSRC